MTRGCWACHARKRRLITTWMAFLINYIAFSGEIIWLVNKQSLENKVGEAKRLKTRIHTNHKLVQIGSFCAWYSESLMILKKGTKLLCTQNYTHEMQLTLISNHIKRWSSAAVAHWMTRSSALYRNHVCSVVCIAGFKQECVHQFEPWTMWADWTLFCKKANVCGVSWI